MECPSSTPRDKPDGLGQCEELCGRIRIALVLDHLFGETPFRMMTPFKMSLLEQPMELVWPEDPRSLSCSIPDPEHADVVGLNQLHPGIGIFGSVPHCTLRLRPFLRRFYRDELRRNESLEAQGELMRYAEFLPSVYPSVDNDPGAYCGCVETAEYDAETPASRRFVLPANELCGRIGLM